MNPRILQECARGGISATKPKTSTAEYAEIAENLRNGFSLRARRLNAFARTFQTLHLAPDSGIFAYQNHQIRPVNHPGRDVGSIEITHRGPSKTDLSDCASSTSRCTTSKR